MSDFDPNPTHRNFYGRRHGKTLRQSQKGYLADDLGTLRPRGITVQDNPDRSPIDPAAIFGDDRPIWLEIGFGGGEHMAAQAATRPDALVIGCEPFLNGVASALRHVEEGGLKNVRIHADDARDLVDALPDASVDRVLILFPDPWHKARHNKRRLLQDETAQAFARILKPGGTLRFVTDWLDYAEWALERLERTPGLERIGPENQSEADQDWFVPPADHVVTRYEEKKLGDTAPIFLQFRRV